MVVAAATTSASLPLLAEQQAAPVMMMVMMAAAAAAAATTRGVAVAAPICGKSCVAASGAPRLRHMSQSLDLRQVVVASAPAAVVVAGAAAELSDAPTTPLREAALAALFLVPHCRPALVAVTTSPVGGRVTAQQQAGCCGRCHHLHHVQAQSQAATAATVVQHRLHHPLTAEVAH